MLGERFTRRSMTWVIVAAVIVLFCLALYQNSHSFQQISEPLPPDWQFEQSDHGPSNSLTHGPITDVSHTGSSQYSGEADLPSQTDPSSHQGFLKHMNPIQLDSRPAQSQTGKHPDHLEIFSASSADKTFFNLSFRGHEATNANIIPSAINEDAWTVVAVKQRSKVPNSIWFAELSCEARFTNGVLECLEDPVVLPIPSTFGDKCTGDHGYWQLNIGPHDGRVFYGPEHPYMIFGSNSKYGCFGLWMQDFRMLVDWGIPVWPDEYFRLPTDLQKPGGQGAVEKNWFAFWDADDKMYIHHDVTPRRVFAEVDMAGHAGPDLGAAIEEHDKTCMSKWLPKLPEDDRDNSFHQATNSLSITLCKRSDPTCKVTDDNTFIMTIIQHKTLFDGHAEYDPYLLLFQRSLPFKLYGISPKPFWIYGRKDTHMDNETHKHTEMLYVTSMSWKDHKQKYHGYIDDVLFIAFGIEDERPAAIDVIAGDLLQDLGFCTD